MPAKPDRSSGVRSGDRTARRSTTIRRARASSILLTAILVLAAGCSEDPRPSAPATPEDAPADDGIAVVLARSATGFELEIRGRAEDLRVSLELPRGLKCEPTELPFAADGSGRRALFQLHGRAEGPITITVIDRAGGRRTRRVSIP